MTRRELLKRLGAAGSGIAFAPGIIHCLASDITIGGKPVEIVITSLSAATVRIALLPIENGSAVAAPDDGGVAVPNGGKRVGGGRVQETFTPVRAGNLVVKLTASPPVVHVETANGELVQRFVFDQQAPEMTFLLPTPEHSQREAGVLKQLLQPDHAGHYACPE